MSRSNKNKVAEGGSANGSWAWPRDRNIL